MFVTQLMTDRASWAFLTFGLSSLQSCLSGKLSSLLMLPSLFPPVCSFQVQLCGRSWKRRWGGFQRLSNWQRKFEEFIALVIKNSREEEQSRAERRAVYVKGCLWTNRKKKKGKNLPRWEKICLSGWGLMSGLRCAVNLCLCLALWNSQNRFVVQTFSLKLLKVLICFPYHIWANIICWTIMFEAKTAI